MKAVVWIHGKGGSAAEAAHYRPLFPDCEVIGLDYRARTPWEAKAELPALLAQRCAGCTEITLIANSIGAFFSMHAGLDEQITRAFFISPIVDMGALIRAMMERAGVSETALREKGEIPTDFGEPLSWEYLSWVRSHPICWNAPTAILCGGKDGLTPITAIRDFAEKHRAALTVMENGEHWFHTEEQLRFLDAWIRSLCA